MTSLAGALQTKLFAALSAQDRLALETLRSLSAGQKINLYLVGGAVRDLLLGRGHLDLDLVTETEVASLAQACAEATGAKTTVHARFGTASVKGAGFHLDLAQTRRETYAQPGALPAVEPAPLLDDLARRDFSINAMALRLTGSPELIDPFGGAADLRSGLVRVLHEQSFRDDATRMLRAGRYATRLGLVIEPLTSLWIERDLLYLDAISGPRLRRELALNFEEEGAVDTALMASRLGILGAIEPSLRMTEEIAEAWRPALQEPLADVVELGFCLSSNPTSAGSLQRLISRLHLAGRLERALLDVVRLRDLSDKLAEASAGEASELLDSFAASAIWAVSIMDRGLHAAACDSYLRSWRHQKGDLRGNDLLALGVEPGVKLGETLERLRRERLDGRLSSRQEEIELVKASLKTKD